MELEAVADIARVITFATAGEYEYELYRQKRVTLEACIMRWAPSGSAYVGGLSRARNTVSDDEDPVRWMIAILRALRSDIEAGQLRGLAGRVRAELFSDLLGQAAHLNSDGYRRAATVLAGAVLEDHGRRLALKAGVPLLNAKGQPNGAAFLNDQLLANKAQSKVDHAQVSTWLKMRNDAAHGVTSFEADHTQRDCERMIEGVRDHVAKPV